MDPATPDSLHDAIAAGRAFLESARNADGSWGYKPGQAGRGEPTLLAAAAGMPLAADWLHARSQDWAELGWAGLLVPAICWELDRALAEAWVPLILGRVSSPVYNVPWYDGTIPAWSWRDGTAAWVEPSSYAILSLSRAGTGDARCADARRMILDRQCSDGGWNYGSPKVFQTDLASDLAVTAWATLALPPGEAVNKALQNLAGVLDAPTTLSLALASLAVQRHGGDPAPHCALLAQRIGAQGARQRVDWTALAVAALSSVVEGTHVFA